MSLLRNILLLPTRAARKKEKARLLKYFPKGAAVDDTFIVGFPRSGTTWLSFLIANTNLLLNNSPVQATWWNINDYITTIDPVHTLPEAKLPLPGGRFVFTHSEYHVHYRKVVYLVRDPRDVMVSYYDFACKNGKFSGSMDDFLRDPNLGIEVWIRHVEGWLNRDGLVKIHFIKYRNLHRDTLGVLSRLYHFFGLSVSPELLQAAIERSSFENMKRMEEEYKQHSFEPNKQFKHVRKGHVSEFYRDLTEAQIVFIEQRCKPLMRHFQWELAVPETGEFQEIALK